MLKISLGCSSMTFSLQDCAGPGTLWNRVKPLLVVVPCVIAFSLFVMMFCVKELYAEFGYVFLFAATAKLKTPLVGLSSMS
jgi:hypothetical protein